LINSELKNICEINKKYKIIKNQELQKPFLLKSEHFIEAAKEKLEELTCSMCLNIVSQPISQCKKCEKLFCEVCINKHILIKNNCPNCRNEPFIKEKLGRFAKSLLNHYSFICPMSCGEKFNFFDADKHKNSCQLRYNYKCSLCEKNLDYHTNLIDKHKIECENINIPCSFCKKIISKFDYEKHLIYCEESLDYCRECNLIFCRKYQEAHNNFFCQKFTNLSHLINKLETF